MPRFANMLANGMESRGHNIEIWSAQPFFFKLNVSVSVKKWMGYIDQYIIFPLIIIRRLKKCSDDTLFVFCDQALGPWIPLVNNRPHVIHCHDFLAQRSALGEIPENTLSWSGRLYQSFIRKGYSKGKNFISVSYKTKADLHVLLQDEPLISEVVYNGLNQSFSFLSAVEARNTLSKSTGIDLTNGFILHVGGNQWYKNRTGVIEIYNAWKKQAIIDLPLLLIGYPPSADLSTLYNLSPHKANIHLLSGLADEDVKLAYSGASVFLFPSLAEGFGWPIAEAMASGCPVITTNEAPMTEVAGQAGFLIRPRHGNKHETEKWAMEAADLIKHILSFSKTELNEVIELGLLNAKRFEPEETLDKVEIIYNRVLQISLRA